MFKKMNIFTFALNKYSSLGKVNILTNSRKYICSFTNRKLQSEKYEHYFGYEKVSPQEKQKKVQAVFTNVASKYDLMNDVMSGGIHRLWKDYFIHVLSPLSDTKLLDVAGGTGDIAIRFLQACTLNNEDFDLTSDNLFPNKANLIPNTHVFVLDMNEKMLSICLNRAQELGFKETLTCIQGNAELLPFQSNYFDFYTIGFGIRNVVHIQESLNEAYRVLVPGGRFLCLEFSQVQNGLFNSVYNWYSQKIIPVMGEIVAGDWKSYQYLVESIQKFPNQIEFSQMIEDAGFKMVTYENLLNGIAAIHSGYKM